MEKYPDEKELDKKLGELNKLEHRLLRQYSQNREFLLNKMRYFSPKAMTDEQLDEFVKLSYAVAMQVIIAYHGETTLGSSDSQQ